MVDKLFNQSTDVINAFAAKTVDYAYNVKSTSVNAPSDGVTDARAALNTLVNTTLQVLGAGGEVFFPEGTYLINLNLTVPQNVRLTMMAGAKLKAANGVIVKLPPNFNAGRYQVLETVGTGKFLFEGATPDVVYPEWWGAKGDGVTDVLPAFDKMIAAIFYDRVADNRRAAQIFLSSGNTYIFSDSWHIDVPVKLTSGTTYHGAAMIFPANKAGIILHSANTKTGVDIGRTAAGSIVENMRMFGNGNSNTVTQTHTVNVSGLIVTKTAGADFTDALGYIKGTTIHINGFPYVIESRNSLSQLTLKKPSYTFYSPAIGATVLTKAVDYSLTLPTDGSWNGQSIIIDGNTYTITSNNTTSITISTGILTAESNIGEIQGIGTITGGAARPNIYPGIEVLTGVELKNNHIWRFPGDGIRTATSITGFTPNSNNSRLVRNSAYLNAGNGFFAQGQDANQINLNGNDFSTNGGAGIYESSFLGNNYDGNHTATNWNGSRVSVLGSVNQSTWVGEYSEADQPTEVFSGGSLIVGGFFGRLPSKQSQGTYIRSANGRFLVNKFISKMEIDTNNTKTTMFGTGVGGLNMNSIFGFGAGEERANLLGGLATTPADYPAYQMRYDLNDNGGVSNTGWYYLGYTPDGLGSPFTGLLGFSGFKAAAGGGKLNIPYGGIFGRVGSSGRDWQYVTSIPDSASGAIGDVSFNKATSASDVFAWVKTAAAVWTPMNVTPTIPNVVNGGFTINGTNGTDNVGLETKGIGFGTVGGATPYLGQTGRIGAGIRLASAYTGLNDGAMILTTRNDALAPFVFYNNGELMRMDNASIRFNKPLLFQVDNNDDIGAAGATRPRTGYFGTSVFVGASKVLDARQTGWTSATGTANKGAFASDTATLQDVARRLFSLESDLRTHGLIN